MIAHGTHYVRLIRGISILTDAINRQKIGSHLGKG